MPKTQSLILSAALLIGFAPFASAQSGTRGSSTRTVTNQGYPTISTPSPSVASSTRLGMKGYCPVCIIEMKKWQKGSPLHQVNYDGVVYQFPSDKQKQMFMQNPLKYVPALGGDCAVCLDKMSKRVPGDVFHSATFQGRLFLFPGNQQKEMFLANPQAYANVDLAHNGACAVCRVEMGKEVAGNPQISTMYRGMRYLFPGDKQRQMFLSNPEKYK